MSNQKELIKTRILESASTKQKVADDDAIIETISKVSEKIADCIRNGGKLILCGNGGSASDSLHFAGEIVGRFQKERNPWPAVVLNADVATLTAIGNDYGYDDVFSRQTKAFATNKDLFVGISTSGNSKNIINAVKECINIGCPTLILTGRDGGQLKDMSTYCIVVPSNVTARIQECHINIIHIICELVENLLTE